jgi:effector-binding domain-containing protein
MSKETLEIIRGLSQAAANAYDGAHMENYSLDGQVRKTGLKREEGIPLLDKRCIDGFKVKFYGDSMIINYQSDVRMKDLKENGFENEIVRTINEVKKFLQKEYKTITGKSVSLTAKGEPQVIVQTTSNVRTFVQAYQHYKIGGLKMDQILEPSADTTRDITKKFSGEPQKQSVLKTKRSTQRIIRNETHERNIKANHQRRDGSCYE